MRAPRSRTTQLHAFSTATKLHQRSAMMQGSMRAPLHASGVCTHAQPCSAERAKALQHDTATLMLLCVHDKSKVLQDMRNGCKYVFATRVRP